MLWKNGIKLAKCSINFTPKIQRKIALPGQSTWLKPLSPLFQGVGESAGRSENGGTDTKESQAKFAKLSGSICPTTATKAAE